MLGWLRDRGYREAPTLPRSKGPFHVSRSVEDHDPIHIVDGAGRAVAHFYIDDWPMAERDANVEFCCAMLNNPPTLPTKREMFEWLQTMPVKGSQYDPTMDEIAERALKLLHDRGYREAPTLPSEDTLNDWIAEFYGDEVDGISLGGFIHAKMIDRGYREAPKTEQLKET
jgi:hypothetical protein